MFFKNFTLSLEYSFNSNCLSEGIHRVTYPPVFRSHLPYHLLVNSITGSEEVWTSFVSNPVHRERSTYTTPRPEKTVTVCVSPNDNVHDRVRYRCWRNALSTLVGTKVYSLYSLDTHLSDRGTVCQYSPSRLEGRVRLQRFSSMLPVEQGQTDPERAKMATFRVQNSLWSQRPFGPINWWDPLPVLETSNGLESRVKIWMTHTELKE